MSKDLLLYLKRVLYMAAFLFLSYFHINSGRNIPIDNYKNNKNLLIFNKKCIYFQVERDILFHNQFYAFLSVFWIVFIVKVL